MKRVISILWVSLACLFVGAISFFTNNVYADSMYGIGSGGSALIDMHGMCRTVYNSCGLGIMVPTNTSTEWWYFISNRPGCVSITECCAASGGLPTAANGTIIGSYQCTCN